MKKILCLILSILLVVSLTACGNKTSTETTPDDNLQDNNETITPSETDNEESSNGIRKNGQLPEYWHLLTEKEQKYYNEKIFVALQTFDFETLESLTDSKSEEALERLHEIYDNEQYKKMYEKTVGQVKYLPNSGIVIFKSHNYIFSKWLEYMETNDIELPDSTGYIDKETTDKWYNECYASAPNVYSWLNDLGSDCEIKDGKIVYNLNDLFRTIGGGKLSAIFVTTKENRDDGYAKLLFGQHDYLKDLGYQYISNDGNCPQYKNILTLDLEIMAESMTVFEDNKESFYYEYFEKFYKYDQVRSEIQTWVNENCFATRGFSSCAIYMPVVVEKEYGLMDCTDEELTILKEANLYKGVIVGDCAKDTDSFAAYYDIIETMERQGLLMIVNDSFLDTE